jgi:hypothetical protein
MLAIVLASFQTLGDLLMAGRAQKADDRGLMKLGDG